jgi:hypothetical protein
MADNDTVAGRNASLEEGYYLIKAGKKGVEGPVFGKIVLGKLFLPGKAWF